MKNHGPLRTFISETVRSLGSAKTAERLKSSLSDEKFSVNKFLSTAKEAVVLGPGITLDDVIKEAMRYGRVTMDQWHDGRWCTSIMTRNNETLMFPKGMDSSLLMSITKAIQEARRLGAQPQ